MANLLGKRYVCPVCGGEFLMVNGGDGGVCCCDKPMELKAQAAPEMPLPENAETQLGRKYACEACGSEMICSRASKLVPACCGQEMKRCEPRKINAAF